MCVCVCEHVLRVVIRGQCNHHVIHTVIIQPDGSEHKSVPEMLHLALQWNAPLLAMDRVRGYIPKDSELVPHSPIISAIHSMLSCIRSDRRARLVCWPRRSVKYFVIKNTLECTTLNGYSLALHSVDGKNTDPIHMKINLTRDVFGKHLDPCAYTFHCQSGRVMRASGETFLWTGMNDLLCMSYIE